MGVEAEISVSGYVVYVKYRGVVKTKDLTPLFVTVYEAIPANMLMEISYKYLTWDELDNLDMTFAELDAEEVRWEEFEEGVWING